MISSSRKPLSARIARGLLPSLGCCLLATMSAASGVKITETDGKVQVEIDGEPFTEYHYRHVSRPFFYPVLGPGGHKMTRNWPMAEVAGEDRDHPHHKSLWWAHGDVNGIDFWSESDRAGQTVHDCFTELRSGPEMGLIASRNILMSKEGKIIGTDERTVRFYSHPTERIVDFEITVRASHGDLVFGDTKEGTMALRLNETMRLKPNKFNADKPTGHIVNSEGVRDGETWGKRAAWVDYYGPVDDHLVGVAIFDHPKNPRHPTWWHVRDYGLFAANPFGIHDFERKPAGAGDLTVPSGQSLTFRYRIYFHHGNTEEANVAGHYRDYATRPPTE